MSNPYRPPPTRMNQTELVNHIKTLINEISPTNGLPIPIDGFADDRPIDDMIVQLLPEAARTTLLRAPVARVPVSDSPVALAIVQADGSAVWTKPHDYLRFVRLQLTHWQRAVVVATPQDSELALRQGNRYLQAGVAKPLVVDVGPALEFRPVQHQAELEGKVRYVPDLTADQLPPLL